MADHLEEPPQKRVKLQNAFQQGPSDSGECSRHSQSQSTSAFVIDSFSPPSIQTFTDFRFRRRLSSLSPQNYYLAVISTA